MDEDEDVSEMTDQIRTQVNVLIILNLLLAGISLLKDIFIAHYLGTSNVADAFTLAFFVPDTIGNNLIASAIGVACIPIFSRLSYKGMDLEYGQVVKRLTYGFMLASMVIIMLLILLGTHVFEWLGRGLTQQVLHTSFHYFLWLIPTIFFYPLVMIASSILQTNQRFFLPGLVPVIFNAIFLLAVIVSQLLGLSTYIGGFVISGSIVLAVLIQVIILWYSVFKTQPTIHLRTRKRIKQRELTYVFAIIKIFFPYLMILLSAQSILVVERWIASTLGVGTIAGLNYAYRISQFPMWVFVAALNTVLFPSMSKWMSAKNNEALRLYILKVLKIIVLMTVAMSIGLFLLRVPIVSLLLKKGAFDHKSLVVTTDILAGYSLSIVGQSTTLIGIRYYLAKRQMRSPIIILLATMVLTIVLDYYLANRMGAAGLGYGMAIGSSINGMIFFMLLQKELRPKPMFGGSTYE